MALTVIVGLAVPWLVGRSVTLPVWAQTRIETVLSQAFPQTRTTFGTLQIGVGENWRPHARVSNLQIATPDGAEIIAFSELNATLALRPLLRAQLELKTLSLSGVFMTLKRQEQGGFALLAGLGGNAPQQQAADLAALLTELDDLLLRPGVAHLRSLQLEALTLRYEDERINRAWTVDGGRLNLRREGDSIDLTSDLAILSGGADVATITARYEGEIGSLAAGFGANITALPAADIATQSPAFAWLEVLDAPISGSLRGAVDDEGALEPLNVSFQIGAGLIQPSPGAKPVPIHSARSYFNYQPQEQMLRFDELSVDSSWVKGRLEGQAFLTGDASASPGDLVGQFRLSGLELNPADLYDEPVRFDTAELDARLMLDPFRLDLGRFQITDLDSVITAHGALSVSDQGWEISTDAFVDAVAPERVLALWPENAGPNTRNWLNENLMHGAISNVEFALRSVEGQPLRTHLSFDFDDTDLRFMKQMPLIVGAAGHASLHKDRFVLSVDKGAVTAPEGGIVELAGSSFIVPDVTAKDGTPGVVRVAARSSITAALSMLDQPPLNIMSKANQPVSLAQGRIDATATIALPLIKELPVEAVRFDVSGRLADLQSKALIEGRTVTAAALDLVASNDEVRIGGIGQIDTIPFTGEWVQTLQASGETLSRVTGTVELSPKTLEVFNVGLPPGTVEGKADASITVELPRGGAPRLSLTSDLQGVRLRMAPIGWNKSAQRSGRFELAGTLGEVPSFDRLLLEAPGLQAEGSIALAEGGALERVRFDRLRVGNWLDAPLDLEGRGPGAPVAVVFRGGMLDLRRADLGGSDSSGDSVNTPITVELNRLQVTDTIALRNLRGEFRTGGGFSGRFTGRINGGTGVSGQVVPQGGRSAVRLVSQNAGGVFASAELLKQVRDGQMELTLIPVGTGAAFDGELNVKDIRVVDAPAMAELVNAISLVGLLEGGISFSDVNAKFRLSPDQVTLTQASAIGPSMGLSMDGVYRTDTGQLDMRGVVSPIYILNAIGRVISRPGEGLFGFNYSIRGTTDAPRVAVNPLSVLMPGALRGLFRKSAPDAPRVEGEPEPEPAPEEEIVLPSEER